MENVLFNGYISATAKLINESKSIADLQQNLMTFIEHSSGPNNHPVYFVFDKRIKDALCTNKGKTDYCDFTDQMYLICSKNENGLTNNLVFDRKDLLSGIQENTGRGKKIFYSSLYFTNNLLGYIALEDATDLFQDRKYINLMAVLRPCMGHFKKNVEIELMNQQLSIISMTDALTGIYNRFGMENKGISLYVDSHNSGKNCTLIFLDINRMKNINDKFGHLQGDLAIRTIADAIKKSIPESWIPVRYGGDEFLIIGDNESESLIVQAITKIKMNIAELSEQMELPYDLSASYGYVITNHKFHTRFEEYITKVDKVMYTEKKEFHKHDK